MGVGEWGFRHLTLNHYGRGSLPASLGGHDHMQDMVENSPPGAKHCRACIPSTLEGPGRTPSGCSPLQGTASGATPSLPHPPQEIRTWNTRALSGTKTASPAATASKSLGQEASSLKGRTSTAWLAMRPSLPSTAWNATRCVSREF